jgi:hypothetical protein
MSDRYASALAELGLHVSIERDEARVAGIGPVCGLPLSGKRRNGRLALYDGSVRFGLAQIIGDRRELDACRRLPLCRSRAVQPISGGATSHDQQR